MEEQRPKKVLDQVCACPDPSACAQSSACRRDAIRLKNYSIRTQKTTIYWSKLSKLHHN